MIDKASRIVSNFGTYFEGERATQRMKITETYIPKFKISTLRGNAIIL